MKNLNAKVFLHGLFIAIFSPMIPAAVVILNQGALPTLKQLGVIGIAGLSAGLTYVGKVWAFGTSNPTPPVL